MTRRVQFLASRFTLAPITTRAAALCLTVLLIGCGGRKGTDVAIPASGVISDAIAATPAVQVLSAWLTAFNSGDLQQMRRFDETHSGERGRLAEMEDFRDMTGGFTMVRVKESTPTSVVAVLAERNSDTVAELSLTVDSGTPPRITSVNVRAVPRPPDLAIPRLGEREALAAVRARAEEMAKSDQWSGVLLVARNGQIQLEHVTGLSDRQAKTPITLNTQFRLGSMNKMFTAVATLQLVDAGRIALDDVIGKHLPDYPNKDVASKVTIRHLLTHTGGTGDIFGPEFERNRLNLREHADYVKLYGARGLTHEPGANQRYSNYGFVLLGAIIERVSGMSYYDYVEQKLFKPAGMNATASLPETDRVQQRAIGYMKRNGTWVPNTETLPWRGTAAGGGYSTAGDLLRFAQALESGKLLSRDLMSEATKVQKTWYGYGFGIDGEGKLRSYGHGGGAPGMNGELRVFPELGYVIVGLSNLDPPAASRLVDFFSLRMPTP